jgi:hypothetical protein
VFGALPSAIGGLGSGGRGTFQEHAAWAPHKSFSSGTCSKFPGGDAAFVTPQQVEVGHLDGRDEDDRDVALQQLLEGFCRRAGLDQILPELCQDCLIACAQGASLAP